MVFLPINQFKSTGENSLKGCAYYSKLVPLNKSRTKLICYRPKDGQSKKNCWNVCCPNQCFCLRKQQQPWYHNLGVLKQWKHKVFIIFLKVWSLHAVTHWAFIFTVLLSFKFRSGLLLLENYVLHKIYRIARAFFTCNFVQGRALRSLQNHS